MKRTTLIYSLAALAMAALPAGASQVVKQLQSAKVSTSVQPVKALSESKVSAGELENSFGKRLIELYKSQGLPLPMSEEQMMRLHPGTPGPLMTAAQEMPEVPVTFTGYCQFSATPEGRRTMKYGFYTFGTEDGLVRKEYKNVDYCVNGGGSYIGHRFYGMSNIPMPIDDHMYEKWYFVAYDTDLWTPLENHGETGYPAWDYIVRSSAYDEAEGITYAFNSHQDLIRIDYEAYEDPEVVAENVDAMAAIAIHPTTGQMYGVNQKGEFCKINKANGEVKVLGTLDFPFFMALQSMTFDKRTGKLYLVAPETGPNDAVWSSLRELNLEDGSTNWFAYMPECEEYTCLNIIYPADDKAPADVADLHVEWPEAGVNGEVVFTAPAVCVDGSELSGDIAYTITLNDMEAEAISGVATAGTEVRQPIVAPEEGALKVVAVLSANGAEGNRNAIASWAGEDTPTATGLTFNYDADALTATISWTNPPVGANGGYIDPSKVTFDVVRYPDGAKVAEKTSDTTVTDDLSQCEYDGYYYTVTAYCGDKQGASISTEAKKVGRGRSLPYIADLSNEDTANAFTMIDGNGDGETFALNPWWNGGAFMSEYTYETGNDEWLLSPALRLEEGMTYHFSSRMGSLNARRPEMASLSYGIGDNTDTYATILPDTEFTTDFWGGTMNEETYLLVPSKTGDYHIAIHHSTPAETDGNVFIVMSFKVEEGLAAAVPAAVTDLTATPAEEGELECTLSFTAPTLNVGGSNLTSLSKIEVYRGEEMALVTTLNNVAPGNAYTVTDKDAFNGNIKYTVVAFNEAGAGAPADVTEYVGIDQPSVPLNVAIKDNLDGTATLSWTAPEEGIHGAVLDYDDLYYTVYVYDSGRWTAYESDIEGTSCTVSAPATGNQGFLFYSVAAVNELGESDKAEAEAICVGSPYTIPYIEGFSATNLAGVWFPNGTSEYMTWSIYSGMSADGDNYVMGLKAKDKGVGTLTSGKISLKGAESPKLTVAFLHEARYDNSVEIYVKADGGEAEKCFSYSYSDVRDFAWRMVVIDLDKFKDSNYINVILAGVVEDRDEYGMFYFDDLSVRDVPADNLEIALSAPSRMTGGTEGEASVTVHNVGANEAESYKVELYANGTKVSEYESEEALASFGRNQVNMKFTASPADEQIDLKAVVVYAPDMIAADNESSPVTVKVFAPLYEAPGTLSENSGKLSWEAVEGNKAVTETFESYPAFNMNGFGDWTVIDGDLGYNFSFLTSSYPGKGERGAFFVVNFVDLGADPSVAEYVGHSGEQFAACARPNSGFNDDWMISPELSGDAQTISLWVRSHQQLLNADFEILASSTGCDVADFSLVESYSDISGEWTEYTAELPEGSKYFAIHCKTMMGGLLQIDDVTFYGKHLTLKGYNVYCNGLLVATTAADVTEYVTNATGVYCVTAMYEEGESGATNLVEVKTVGVASIYGEGMKVAGGEGAILFKGVEGRKVSVANAAGVVIFSAADMKSSAVPAAAGIYLVTVDGITRKVIVK